MGTMWGVKLAVHSNLYFSIPSMWKLQKTVTNTKVWKTFFAFDLAE